MNAFIETTMRISESLSLIPTLQQRSTTTNTKRIEELEARIAELQSALRDAEDELEREKTRLPEIGDFVRCPLTNFFGRVTKVVSRPSGRPWLEIVPYLANDLPGHSTMDLFDSWELIDQPSGSSASPPPPPVMKSAVPALPAATGLSWPERTPPDAPSRLPAAKPPVTEEFADELEWEFSKIWQSSDSSQNRS
jgi:hypothetical protein